MRKMNESILLDNHILRTTGELFYSRAQDTSFTARCMLGAAAMQAGGELFIPNEMYQMFVDGSIAVSILTDESGTVCIKIEDNDEKPKQDSNAGLGNNE